MPFWCAAACISDRRSCSRWKCLVHIHGIDARLVNRTCVRRNNACLRWQSLVQFTNVFYKLVGCNDVRRTYRNMGSRQMAASFWYIKRFITNINFSIKCLCNLVCRSDFRVSHAPYDEDDDGWSRRWFDSSLILRKWYGNGCFSIKYTYISPSWFFMPLSLVNSQLGYFFNCFSGVLSGIMLLDVADVIWK